MRCNLDSKAGLDCLKLCLGFFDLGHFLLEEFGDGFPELDVRIVTSLGVLLDHCCELIVEVNVDAHDGFSEHSEAESSVSPDSFDSICGEHGERRCFALQCQKGIHRRKRGGKGTTPYLV